LLSAAVSVFVCLVALPTCEPDQIRRKDRRSYRFDLWSIELTRVDQYSGAASIVRGAIADGARATSTTFEVEVEIKEMDFLRREAAKVRAGQPNDFVKIGTAFLDTLRTLSQFAFPGQLPPNLKQQQQQQHASASAAGAGAGAAQPPAVAAAAASATKKRPREDEQQAAAAAKQEYGKAWS
jgi:hypothetical protein